MPRPSRYPEMKLPVDEPECGGVRHVVGSEDLTVLVEDVQEGVGTLRAVVAQEG